MTKKQSVRKLGPNKQCLCGRGNKKYKHCCGRIKEELRIEEFMREKYPDK